MVVVEVVRSGSSLNGARESVHANNYVESVFPDPRPDRCQYCAGEKFAERLGGGFWCVVCGQPGDSLAAAYDAEDALDRIVKEHAVPNTE